MIIVLDTNVVSELMRPEPSPRVLAWVDRQDGATLHLTAITVAELGYGVLRLPPGHRRERLAALVDDMVRHDFGARVLSFDHAAAEHYGRIVATREGSGRPISMADAQIAAICRSYDAMLVTRDVAGFASTGVDVIDPWHATDEPS